jgi:hypothetical protein
MYLVALLGRRARHTLPRLAFVEDGDELLATVHVLEREPDAHPVKRARHAREVQAALRRTRRCPHGAKNGVDT